VHIRIGKNEQLNASKTVQQVVEVMQDQQKTSNLLKLCASLRNGEGGASDSKILIFVNRKIMCGKLVTSLCNHGYLADTIHGDRPQAEREAVLHQFRAPVTTGRNRLQYLVATDVAARGIDVKE
jgi:superfamily II DNA/RNA helicase